MGVAQSLLPGTEVPRVQRPVNRFAPNIQYRVSPGSTSFYVDLHYGIVFLYRGLHYVIVSLHQSFNPYPLLPRKGRLGPLVPRYLSSISPLVVPNPETKPKQSLVTLIKRFSVELPLRSYILPKIFFWTGLFSSSGPRTRSKEKEWGMYESGPEARKNVVKTFGYQIRYGRSYHPSCI